MLLSCVLWAIVCLSENSHLLKEIPPEKHGLENYGYKWKKNLKFVWPELKGIKYTLKISKDESKKYFWRPNTFFSPYLKFSGSCTKSYVCPVYLGSIVINQFSKVSIPSESREPHIDIQCVWTILSDLKQFSVRFLRWRVYILKKITWAKPVHLFFKVA